MASGPHTFICSIFFSGLFPAVLNLASNALITTNATCGEKEPEMYCKLVEHVPGQPVRNPQCRICNQNSSNPSRTYFNTFLVAMRRIYNREILQKICIQSLGLMILKIPSILVYCELIYSPSLTLDKH